MKKPTNGHESWNAWNIFLWIGNEEPLYRAAIETLERPTMTGKTPSVRLATRRFLRETGLADTKTPDGGRYSFRSTYLALAGLRD